MKVRHRIVFNNKGISAEFLSYLKAKDARFDDDGTDLVVAYLYEEDEWRESLYWFLRKEGVPTLVEPVYSNEELESASWFKIRSKYRWEYPQPEDNMSYKNTTYDSSHYCNNCGCGLKQKREFRVNKNPQWGKRNFLMLNWIEDELFINNVVKDKLEQANSKGYELCDVINDKKNIPVINMKQMIVRKILKPGFDKVNESVREIITCKKCGCIKYIYSGRGLAYKKDVFEGIDDDIVKSTEIFGAGHIVFKVDIYFEEFL